MVDERQSVGSRRHEAPSLSFWVFLFLAVIIVGVAAYLRLAQLPDVEQPASNLPVVAEVPPFALTERSGRPLSRGNLDGTVWIADFVFTYCGGPCPLMTRRMSQLQEALKREGLERVKCVSFSVDPERDTPEVLSQYARDYQADGDRWLFVTGDKKAIHDLTLRGFKLGLQEETDDASIIHSTKFVLVDVRGRIRAYYDAITDEEMDDLIAAFDRPLPDDVLQQILADVRGLLREGGA